MKNVFFQCAFCAALMIAPAGCITLNQEEQELIMERQREDSLMLQEDMKRIRSRLDAMEQDMQRLQQEVASANSDQSRAAQSQLQGMNASIEDLQSRIQAVDAARERDRQDIVNALSKQISDVLKKQQAARPVQTQRTKPLSNEGYEHVVQSGETLSAIAKAYSVSSGDIIEANGLQSADMLKVGQKLFIPAP